MKALTILAGLMAAVTLSVPAFAQDTTTPAETGHWEWRAQPNYGPRGPMRPPVRVWVPANVASASNEARTSNCDCGMMHASAKKAAECMEMDKARS